ncbi:hypothetical protein DES40_1748 [Litorimonas taeanensis]|uniref:Uncharacterized protein n=1 Tax=Litorimonas taeanensis TaxID=568099 RepID=A0A420WDK8_9PROT|nr:phage regulatory CII family protein [Litorimonas taeanensis]RKQ68972.1 hypothetical protein DES40_1748 [Litorimonas taeanensis]
MRAFSSSTYRGLKTATKALLNSFGPLKCAAPHSRIESLSCLQRFSSQHSDDTARFMPVDVALDLMAASDNTALLTYMADQLGYDLIAQPEVRGCVLSQTADQIAEGGAVIAKLARTIADGKVTADEVSDLKLMTQLDLVINGAALLKAHFRAIADTSQQAGDR